MTKTIGIIGCGWLGFPLAKELVKDGHVVCGSTTNSSKLQELQTAGIKAFLLELNPSEIVGPISEFMSSLDILIINIPPKLRSNPLGSYYEKTQNLIKAIPSSKHLNILFVSSTSVYGNSVGIITEDTPPSPATSSGKEVWRAEKLIQKIRGNESTILRFGGLIGKGRHPINQLSGTT